jgi:Kdo2-lipid IVA lauroyltransferase/acyltransferase
MPLLRKRPREEGGLADRTAVLAIKLLAKLPWSVTLGLGGALGKLLGVMPFAKPHRIALINLALCFPELSEKKRREIARQNMEMTGRNLMAGLVSWVAPIDAMSAKIEAVENPELLEAAVSAGKGVIFISPHMGCWEFLNFYLCTRFPLTILAKPFGGPALNDLMVAGRSRLLGSLVPTNERGVRALLSSLKSGGMTYLTPDHVPKDSAGVFAPFFGLKTPTGVLTTRLAQKTGATILAVTCTLNDNNRFSIRFVSPGDEVYSRDLEVAVAGVNRVIEQCIRRCPEQYQWAYRRFKAIKGQDSPY